MNTQTRYTDFKDLAAGAAYCAKWGGSFALYCDGEVHDSYDTLDEAADAFVDFWTEDALQKVLEYAPSGRSIDVTADAMERVEAWCHARFEVAPWEVVA